MKIYRVWKINIGAFRHDEEIAFFTSKKKAIDLIKSAGTLKSLRDNRDYCSSHNTFYNPTALNSNPTRKEIIEFNTKVNKGNLIYEVKHLYDNGRDGYYIETITTEN